MSIEVKVGQVWQDKDKRRGERRVEILSIGDAEAHALVVGTENETSLKLDRLVSRWTLIEEKAEAISEPEVEAKPSKFKTREQWLEAAVKELTKVFVRKGFEVPTVRVSVGWPGGRGKKTGVVGQCFPTIVADDKVAQVFVSPAVSDSLKVIATLAHELVHAVDDCKDGHKKNFVKIAKEIGFVPKWTSSENRTDDFDEALKGIVGKLGPFPHAAIRETERPTVQKTYMVLLESLDCDACEEGYKLRMTQKWLDEVGSPLCPHHVEMVPQEK